MAEETRYSNGKIYKLVVVGCEVCYVGSTCNSLTERMYFHNHAAKTETQKQCASSELYKIGQPQIELLEEFPCNSKLELEKRERYWLEKELHAINKNTPTQTWKERWEKNRDHNIAKHKEWYQANQEEQQRKRREQYQSRQAEEKAYRDEYRAAHKDELAAKKKEKVQCPECGITMSRCSLWGHKKNKHKRLP